MFYHWKPYSVYKGIWSCEPGIFLIFSLFIFFFAQSTWCDILRDEPRCSWGQVHLYLSHSRILQCSWGGSGSNSFFSILFCLCIFHKAPAALHLEGHPFHQLFYLHSKSYVHEKCATEFLWRPFEGILDRICHMNLMHANLCRWPHYCGEMDCLIKHIIRHICRLADQIEAVFFEQIPFVKFVSVHAAVLDLGHREEEAGSLVYQVFRVPSNLDCFWRWDNFSTRFISSEGNMSYALRLFVACLLYHSPLTYCATLRVQYGSTMTDNCWVFSYSDIHLYYSSLNSQHNFTLFTITIRSDGSEETMLLLNLARFSPEI